MERDEEKTAVIFRRERQFGKPIIAIFPYISYKPEHRARYEHKVLAYTHIGQHYETDYNVQMAFSTPVTPEEYAPLKRELENQFGYDAKGYDNPDMCSKYEEIIYLYGRWVLIDGDSNQYNVEVMPLEEFCEMVDAIIGRKE